MLPRYVLPTREAGRNLNVETRPKQVEAWLSRLPLSNPVQAAEETVDYVTMINRGELALDARHKIAERLAPVVEDVVAALHEQYSQMPLPLPTRQQHAADLARRLLRELADTYKILLVERLSRRFNLFGGNPVPLYLQRILLALQAVLEISYETHDPVPQGVWVDLHQTYNHALRTNLKDAIPEGGGKMISLEQIYKSTLLLALADPYHFPQIEMPWAKDLIARFSNLATLFPAEEVAKGQAGLFVIEVNTDTPPKPVARESHPMNPSWDLLLNTTELAKHLALLGNHIKGRVDVDKLGLPEAARDPAYPSMLRRLKLNWGASVQRQSQRRRHLDGRDVEVCLGVKSLHQLLSPPTPSDTIHYGAPAPEAPVQVLRCASVNDSMGGLALLRKGAVGHGAQFRVGDAVGVRQDNGNWAVGLIRWFRVPEKGEIFFGVQLLAPKVLAVQLRRRDNGRQWPALMLHPNPVTHQMPMLLAQPGSFEPDSEVELRTPKGAQAVRIDKRLESTPSMDLFRFQM